MGRTLGVDCGEKRIGFALGDPDGIIASAREVVVLENENQAASVIERMCKTCQAERVVLGLPVNMNGTHGPAALKVEALAEVLRARLALPVDLWDERLTTRAAHDILIEAGDAARQASRAG